MKLGVKAHPEGAQRYVVGRALPFDQKNEMFKRPLWDPALLDLGRRFYRDEARPQSKPGYRLEDQALVNAAWRLEDQFAKGILGGDTGLYAWGWDGRFSYPHVPPGLTLNVDNQKDLTRWIKRAARFFGADLVGIAPLDRRWLYSDVYRITPEGGQSAPNELPEGMKSVVVVAVEMDLRAVGHSPAHAASAATGLGYSRMAFTTGLLAQFVRGLGYQAVPCGNDTACSIPQAVDAGLGELGRNGLLITPQYGARVRLAKMFTDLPLEPDRPIEFGGWDFCRTCKKCARHCPGKAISLGDPTEKVHDISNREGILAWHIHAEKCLSFWVKNKTDCSNCIRVCPFNKPPGRLHDLVRAMVGNTSRFNRMLVWADDLLGYGKKPTDGYW